MSEDDRDVASNDVDEGKDQAPDPADGASTAADGSPDGISDQAEGDLLDDQADTAEDFINGLLDVLDMDGEATADFTEDDSILVEVKGPDMAVLIGRHGATLDAIQELTRAAVQHKTSARAFLTLDIEGYRDRQQAILERKALEAADEARRDGVTVLLEPMNAYERRIVHQALADVDDVVTSSEGEDPDRYVTVSPA